MDLGLDRDLELGTVRDARAWLISAAAGDLTAELATYIAELGPVAARQQLLEGTALAGVAALLGVDRALDDFLAAGERIGARLVIPEEAEWPATLRAEGVFAPLGPWVRGTACLDQVLDHAVAFVGSRASTAYREHVASDMGQSTAARSPPLRTARSPPRAGPSSPPAAWPGLALPQGARGLVRAHRRRRRAAGLSGFAGVCPEQCAVPPTQRPDGGPDGREERSSLRPQPRWRPAGRPGGAQAIGAGSSPVSAR